MTELSFAVVIPTHDRPALLRECLQAVAAQSLPPREVVVVNDGGPPLDRVVAGLRLPLRVLRNETSRGPPGALNRGIRDATSEYVALCDDDDLFSPDHLEALARTLSASNAGLAYTDVRAFEADPSRPLGLLDRDFDPELLRVTNYIASCSIAFRRALWEDLQGFDESLGIYWDWDFFLRISARAPMVHSAGAGSSFYRVHPNSLQSVTPGPERTAQLQRLCDKHRLGTLPVKHLFDLFRPISPAMPTLTIDTDRLTLRPHRLEDFPDTRSLWVDPVVTKYIGGRPSTEEEVWQRLLRYAGHWAMLGYGFWTVRERGSDRFVGEVGVMNGRREMDPPFGDTPEIGWALAPSAHGKGYATEAVRAALGWAEQHFGPKVRTVCMIHPENQASLRVAEKVGFREYARTTYKGAPSILFER